MKNIPPNVIIMLRLADLKFPLEEQKIKLWLPRGILTCYLCKILFHINLDTAVIREYSSSYHSVQQIIFRPNVFYQLRRDFFSF